MSTFQADWNAAKTKFEIDTGMKKPSDTTKVGFGKLSVSFKKYTGIENALKKVDELMPDNTAMAISAGDEKKLGKAIDDLTKEVSAYIAVLTKTADDEKAMFGKTSVYRDIKVLRASLDSIASRARSDCAKIVAYGEMMNDSVQTAMKGTVQTLKSMKASLENQVKKSIVTAQQILANPMAATFNGAFPKAARDVTQELNNIAKFTMPDDINAHSKSMADEKLKDPGVFKAAQELNSKVINVKALIRPLIAESGTSAATASLSKMANSPIKLADNATPQDVIAATKQFIGQLKVARDVAAGIG